MIKLMQAKPNTIYSDEEGAFVSNIVQRYLSNEDIRHLVTRAHASVAERAIRTFTSMLFKKSERKQTILSRRVTGKTSDDIQWIDFF